jgi:hypothetical protein
MKLKTAAIMKEDLYETLVEIVGILGINTSKKPRQLNLANKIKDFVEKKCPLSCLTESEIH